MEEKVFESDVFTINIYIAGITSENLIQFIDSLLSYHVLLTVLITELKVVQWKIGIRQARNVWEFC